MRRAETTSEKMIKVDHAGENGAVNIYRAQRLASQVRARRLLPELRHFQEHEEEHRHIFAAYLKDNGVRRCFSYHLCGIGGFGLGLVTGLIGPKAVYATTYAVENVVLDHLEHQMLVLRGTDDAAYDCVEKIVIDEREHHDSAKNQLGSEHILTRALISLVKLCTEAVIRLGMR